MVRTVLLAVAVGALVGGPEARGQTSAPPPPADSADSAPVPPAVPRPKTIGQRIYPSLAPVRENLSVLGTPICVFVGYFPAGDDAWVRELCYDKAVV